MMVPTAALEELDDTIFSKEEFGARIRQIRSARKLSLLELSQLSKVSVAMLSHVERGTTLPSLNTVQKLGIALGVPLSDLFKEVGHKLESAKIVVRKEERLRLHTGGVGVLKELLSPLRTSDLEMLMLVLDPGAHSGKDPWIRNGEKAGMVLAGSFELVVGDTTFNLTAGDSFQFDGTIPHRFRNLSEEQTHVMWIIKADSLG